MLMFGMDIATAEEFYRRCIDRDAKTEEERTNILVELAEEGKMKSVVETQRTPEQVAQDMAKNFGNVLHIKPAENPDAV